MIDSASDDFGELPDGLDELVKPELMPGERLHWSSRSDPRRGGPRSLEPLLALFWAIGFGAFGAIAFVLGVRQDPFWRSLSSPPMLVTLFASILGFLALMVAAMGFLSAWGERAWRRRPAVYALTDRRAIVWSPVAGSKAYEIRSFPWATIKIEQISRSQWPDGSGSVYFRAPHDASGFIGIADARRVEWLLRELQGSRLDARPS